MKIKKISDKYFRYIYWSDTDKHFIGCCPELNIKIHRKDNDQKKLFKDLCDVIDFHVEDEMKRDDSNLPKSILNKEYSGELRLRLGEHLHRMLAVESYKQNMSINSLITGAIENFLK